MRHIGMLVTVLLIAVSSVLVRAEPTFCPQTTALDFRTGDAGRTLSDMRSRLRAEPALDGEILKTITGNTPFIVQGDATCADYLRWWPIEAEGQIGWAAEGQGADSYYMERVEAERPDIDNSALIETWGNGFTEVAWTPDRSTLVVGSTKGLLLYAGDDLEAEPRLLTDANGSVYTMAIDPSDANILYAGYQNGVISRWNMAEGVVESSTRFDAAIVDILPNESAQALAIVLDTGDVQLVTSDDYSHLTSVTPERSDATAAAFSHDGTMIAVGSGGLVEVFDRQGQRLKVFTMDGSTTHSIAFSPDDRLLAAADNELFLWDVASQTPLLENIEMYSEQFDEMTKENVDRVLFLQSGQLLTIHAAGLGHIVTFWDVHTLSVIGEWGTPLMFDLFVSSDGRMLTYTTLDIFMPNILSLEEFDLTRGYGDFVTIAKTMPAASILALTPDGSHLIRESVEGFEVVDTQTQQLITSAPVSANSILKAAVSPDGRYFAACTVSGSYSAMEDLVVYDLAGSPPSVQYLGSEAMPVACSFLAFVSTPEGPQLIFDTYYSDHQMLWNPIDGSKTQITLVPPVEDFFSPGGAGRGTTFVLFNPWGDIGSFLAVYDLTQLEAAPRLINNDARFRNVALVSDDMFVATTGYDGRDLIFYDLTTLREIHQIPTSSAIKGMAASPDGTWLATVHADGRIRLWRADDPAMPLIVGHVDYVPDGVRLVFSPDNQRLYTDNYVWDLSQIIGK